MKIVISDFNNDYLEIINIENLDNIHQTQKKFSSKKGPLQAQIFVINESISFDQLSKLKNNFDKNNICSLSIYSNNRDTIVTGKALKINSIFRKEEAIKRNLTLLHPKNKFDILHNGTVRSGDRISSNGNLCIVGDVNPGAIISANKNIYVWGKLLGIAFAGKDGDNKASIASLYLNPLQLRIADVVAIGPKDKPQNFYPEIALVHKQTIVINPYIINAKN